MRIILIFAFTVFTVVCFSQTTYTFNGNGKWSDSNNWVNKQLPPDLLDSASKIIIDPGPNGECVLDTLQFVLKGASINVAAGKHLKLANNRNLNTGAKVFNGKLILPQGSTVNFSDLSVYSFLHKINPGTNGNFRIMVSDTSAEDILLVTNRNNEVLMLNYFTDTTKDFTISAKSTAISLLVLYPLLQPIDVNERKKQIEQYQGQPEFSQLVTQIEIGLTQGRMLFDSTNDILIGLLNNLMAKDYNNVRSRQLNTNSILSTPGPIDIESATVNSTFTIKNTAKASYTGQIYRRVDNTPVGSSFNIAGKYLQENSTLKFVIAILKGSNAVKKEQTLDLKALGGTPGEYEIRITSGDLASTDVALNKDAATQNISELLVISLANLIPGLSDLVKNPCFSIIFSTVLNGINPVAIFNAVDQGTVVKSYVAPMLKDIGSKLLVTQPLDCAIPDPAKVAVNGLLSYALIIPKLVPAVLYVTDWGLNPKTLVACQFLDQNFNTSSCIKVKAWPLTDDTRICKTTTLKVSTVENEKYYPYTSYGVGNKDIVLQASDGKFVSTNFLGVLNAKTDQFGDAQTDWKTPGIVKDAKVKVSAFSNGIEISADTFKTKTSKYNPVAAKLEYIQTGEINKPLPKFIQFVIADKIGVIPEAIPLEKYSVSYVTKGGGSLQLQPDEPNQGIYVIYKWILGPDEGAQSVTFTISTIPCDALSVPEEILSFVFTATAYDPAKLFLTTTSVNTITSTSAISGGNIVSVGVSPVTERGVCWSTSPNPTIGNNKMTTSGTDIGSFISNITGLTANTTYFVRAYAINQTDTAYGNEETFSTVDSISLVGSTYSLISWRFQSVPGSVDDNSTSCPPQPHMTYQGKITLFFDSENTYIKSVYDSAKLAWSQTFSYSIGAYYPDSLFLSQGTGTNCTNSYGHQYPEGWGIKIPPGYDLNFGEHFPTRISLDGHQIYQAQGGDHVYIKQ